MTVLLMIISGGDDNADGDAFFIDFCEDVASLFKDWAQCPAPSELLAFIVTSSTASITTFPLRKDGWRLQTLPCPKAPP